MKRQLMTPKNVIIKEINYSKSLSQLFWFIATILNKKYTYENYSNYIKATPVNLPLLP